MKKISKNNKELCDLENKYIDVYLEMQCGEEEERLTEGLTNVVWDDMRVVRFSSYSL